VAGKVSISHGSAVTPCILYTRVQWNTNMKLNLSEIRRTILHVTLQQLIGLLQFVGKALFLLSLRRLQYCSTIYQRLQASGVLPAVSYVLQTP